MTSAQTKELLAGQEAAISLRESLDIINQGDIQVIALAIADLRSTVVGICITELILELTANCL